MKKQIFTKGKIKIGILFFAILLMIAGFSYLQNINSTQAQNNNYISGTWSNTFSGLSWNSQWGSIGNGLTAEGYGAVEYCQHLNTAGTVLTDSLGAWRLPTRSELLKAMSDQFILGLTLPPPQTGFSFDTVNNNYNYWSSTEYNNIDAYNITYNSGEVYGGHGYKAAIQQFRCVRTPTVTFDSQSASVPANPTTKTVTIPATNVVTLPTAPTKTGYTFSGWYTAINGGGTQFTAATPVTANITVYAKWTGITHTVTFDSQSASVPANPTTKTVTIPATNVVTLPTTPTKTGSTFGGWYTAVNGGGTEFTATTPVTANITVYAKWGPPCISGATDINCWSRVSPTQLTWGPQDVTTGVSTSTTLSNGKANTAILRGLSTTAYPAANYCYNLTEGGVPAGTWYLPSFAELSDGWASLGSGGFPNIDYLSSTEKFQSQIWALHAVGAGGLFSFFKSFQSGYVRCLQGTIVTFDSQSAAVPATPTTKRIVPPATTVEILPTTPTKTGYTFGGWYTAENGGGTAFTATTPVIANITVYAKWTANPNYIVTFDGQSATVPANPTTKTVVSPATTVVTLPTTPAKTGYTFRGWYTAENGGGTAFTATTRVTEDITVYAKWIGNSTSSAAINSFSFTDPSLTGIVDGIHKVIYVPTPDNTDLSNLTPIINVSSGATVSPYSGQSQNFEKGTKTYTVTARDGSKQDYTVVISGRNSDTSIESFSLTNSSTGEITGSIDAKKNTISVFYNDFINDFTFTPKIKLANENAVISPASGVKQDFYSPIVYTVTAKDGITKTNYTVTFVNPKNSAKEITTAVFGLYKKSGDQYERGYNGPAEISRKVEISKDWVRSPGGASVHPEIITYHVIFHIPFGYYQSYVNYYVKPSQVLGISKFAKVATYLGSETEWVNPADEYFISVNDYPIDYVVTAQDGSQQTYKVSVINDPPVFGIGQIGQYCGISACGDKNTQLNQAGVETLSNPLVDTIQVGPYRQLTPGNASVVSCPENTNYDVCVENQNDGLANYVLLGVKYQTYLSISAYPTFVKNGSATKIAWAVSNMTNCIASGGSTGWAGNLSSSSGPQIFATAPLTTNGTVTYNISCTGPDGVVSKSVDVYVKNFTEISNWTQLNNIRNNPSGNYILTANLSSKTVGYAGIGDKWVPIKNFSGTLNGNNKIIADLVALGDGSYSGGLFETLSGNISNLGLVRVNAFKASFAMIQTGGIIIDSYATGNVAGKWNNYYSNTGGLVGTMSGGLIFRSHFDGKITNTFDRNDSGGSGGLVGLLNGGSIMNSYVKGDLSSGSNDTSIGGICGGSYSPNSTVSNSYHVGVVTGSYYSNYICARASTVDHIKNSYTGPTVINNNDNNNQFSKSTIELLSPSTYTGWTPDVWNISIGQYPTLKSYYEVPPVGAVKLSVSTTTVKYHEYFTSRYTTLNAKISWEIGSDFVSCVASGGNDDWAQINANTSGVWDSGLYKPQGSQTFYPRDVKAGIYTYNISCLDVFGRNVTSSIVVPLLHIN
jgi:uncharacterized repeat protein (TIGR02543 family)